MSRGQDFFVSPMPKYFGLAPYRFPVFWNAGNKLLSIKKGQKGWPLTVLQGVLTNSEILKGAHDYIMCGSFVGGS